MAIDIGYHSPQPMYPGHEPMRKMVSPPKLEDGEFTEIKWGEVVPCPYVGEKCYYDGSSLAAHEFYSSLLREGLSEEKIWAKLESVYHSQFGVHEER